MTVRRIYGSEHNFQSACYKLPHNGTVERSLNMHRKF